ncbi:MAG: tRNA (adenosine(37)-N6)-dimethylallyltransferase MiaA [Planctomycetes bacterium]|nr:tRNA (adenosine(37)-N6)-dimethylallyltransferase MiaA [Planctomycetota bacterium]
MAATGMANTTPEQGGGLPLLFLVGNTASGKKQAALAVADALPVELLSLDSMKVYRGMDRGTDKQWPTRFRLTNLADPRDRFSTGDWVRAAQQEVSAIRATGRIPLFVGGTGLYLRALLRGLSEIPAIPPEIRSAVAAEIERDGSVSTHARLAALDPTIALRLHPNDRKRIVRALEVVRATGQPLSWWQEHGTRVPIAGRAIVVGIRYERATLHRRIRERVARMFAEGLIEEVRALAAEGALGPVAGLAIGYREVVELLQESGAPDGAAQERCAQRVASDTTAFVRRQDNWFRQFAEIAWIDAEPTNDDAPQSVPRRVIDTFQRSLTEQSSRSV